MKLKRINILTRHYKNVVLLIKKDFLHKDGQYIIDGYYFVWNQPVHKDDIIVVMDYPHENTIKVINSPTILWQSEPDTIYDFPLSYINKFDYIISAFPEKKNTSVQRIKNGLSMCSYQTFLAKESYESLEKPQQKTKVVSLVTSNLTITPAHIRRVKFVHYLLKKKSVIDILGFSKKIYLYDGLRDYKYTVVLENCTQNNHFTEKLTDALRSGCFVFYYGCPNIKDFFDMGSLVEIDITRMDEALRTIHFHIENNAYEKNLDSIQKNKQVALDMNYYSYIVKVIQENTIVPGPKYHPRTILIDKKDKPVYSLGWLRYFFHLRYLFVTMLTNFFRK